jgi:peptidyl-prolyl cis-trans isomerase C
MTRFFPARGPGARLAAPLAALWLSACTPAPSTGPAVAASGPTPGVPAPPASADPNAPLPSPLPEIAARVNGQPLPTRSVRILVEQGVRRGAIAADQRPRAYRAATEQLVVRELLYAEAVSRRLRADDARLEQAYNEARVPYRDDATWVAFLAEQGLDVASFRNELRAKFTIEALLQAETRDIPAVSDAELRDFYLKNPRAFESGERLRAAHILLRVGPGASAEEKAAARGRIEALLAKVRGGADFAALARQSSEDPGSNGKGGELDVFGRGQMAKPFEDAAFTLKPGDVSGVVESPFGFHLIKLLERLPSQRMTFEQAREPLRQRLEQERQQARIRALVDRLRAGARIEMLL